MHQFMTSAVLCAGLFLVGCQNESIPGLSAGTSKVSNSSHSTGAVAVIDIDEVGKRIGTWQDIAKQLKDRGGVLNEQLASLQQSAKDQIAEKEQSLGPNPHPEQKDELDTLRRNLNTQLLQARQKAQLDLQRMRATLITQLRKAVRPVAQQVATEKGYSVVVSKNETVIFAFDPSVEITTEVANRLSKAPAHRVADAPEDGETLRR